MSILIKPTRFIAIAFLTSILFLLANVICQAASKKDSSQKMTVIELQSELMSFADRFGMIMFQAFDNFNARGPSPEARYLVHGDMIYTTTSVFTIAALPNPEAALLDMAVVTTLGRMIYELKIREKFGTPIKEIIKGFQKVETDIWRIAQKVLNQEQQQELRSAIKNWLSTNPDQLQYYYIRFSELGANRGKSTLVQSGKTGGLFESVQEATQEIEETRMLVERSIYLATRLPLLTGHFAEFWTSQLIANPEVEKILADLHGFLDVSQHLATIADQLPQQIAHERRTIIKEASKEMANLRQSAIEHVAKEANTWRDTTVDKVMDRVAEEREALINQLMNRIAMERQKVEIEGEKIVDHTFRQAVILIIIWLAGYVPVRLLLQRVSNK